MANFSDRRIGSIVLADVTTAGGAITTNAGSFDLGFIPNGVVFIIDVTAAATDTADTLNITIETKIGAKWHPVYQSSEFLGDGGAKIESSDKISATGGTNHDTTFGGTLAANAHLAILGVAWRVAYVQVDGDGDASFAFTVTAAVM